MKDWQGVVFHYFEDEKHIRCQGSLSASQFNQLLDELEKKYIIISPEEYLDCFERKEHLGNRVFLSFDGGLKSQVDIAYPLLKERGLSAFWFPYTNVLTGEIAPIEIYHHFRFYCYNDIDIFYDEFLTSFMNFVGKQAAERYLLEASNNLQYEWGKYYSKNDRIHKYLRDNILSLDGMNSIMTELMLKHGYQPEQFYDGLWITPSDLVEISENGNIVGSHSHTHPFRLDMLSPEEQLWEYCKSKEVLETILGKKVQCVTYPANRYSESTIKMVKKAGYHYGFTTMKGLDTRFEIQRIDHAMLLRRLNGD